MKFFKKYVCLIGLILCGAFQADFASTMPEPELINRAVAIVNNQVITSHELQSATQSFLSQAQARNIPLPDDRVVAQKMLDNLITQKIVLQLAQNNDIQVTDQQVNGAIDTIKSNNQLTDAQFLGSLKSQGISLAQFKDSIRKKLIIQQLEQSAIAGSIQVSDQEAEHYLKRHQALKKLPKEYRVEHILFAPPDNPTPSQVKSIEQESARVYAKLKQGMSFKKAAVTYSKAPDALDGGDLGWKPLDLLPQIFVPVVKQLKPGQLSKPFKDANGIHLVKLVAVRQPKLPQHFETYYHLLEIGIPESPMKPGDKVQLILNRIKTNIAQGKSFGDMARINSLLPSADKNGDVGWLPLSALPPQIASFVKANLDNTISGPIQVNKTWYLIKILGQKRKNVTSSMNLMAAKQALFEKKAQSALETWQQKIRGESYIRLLKPLND